jgi:hypothetical protein
MREGKGRRMVNKDHGRIKTIFGAYGGGSYEFDINAASNGLKRRVSLKAGGEKGVMVVWCSVVDAFAQRM